MWDFVYSYSHFANLICAGRQDVISGGVKTESSNGSFVNSHQLQSLRRRDVPNPDRRIVWRRDDDVLCRMVHDAVDLLRVTFENGNNLKQIIGL